MRKIIISPQAGMCNRFRAICSAILMGRLSNRQVVHNWTVEEELPGDIDIIRDMRASTLTTFFQANEAIPYQEVHGDTEIGQAFSEWLPQEAAFPRQCSALRRRRWSGPIYRERDSADAIINSSTETILLETSLALKPSSMSQESFEKALSDIYRECFVPLQSYNVYLEGFERALNYVGVHIRRTDHLKYIAEAHVSAQAWADMIKDNVGQQEPIYLCSDDEPFVRDVMERLPSYSFMRLERPVDLAAKDYAFLEFLCLSRASRIYGTVASSFSTEAARFGGIRVYSCGASPALQS